MMENHNINVPGKFYVTVGSIPKTRWNGKYSKVEMPKMKYSKTANIKPDVFTALVSISRGAQALFLAMMAKTNPHTNMCHYPIDKYTLAQKSMFSRSLGGLLTQGVYKRIPITQQASIGVDKGADFMLNPYMYFANGDLAVARTAWDGLP